MEKHYILDNDEFERQVKNKVLDPALFSHEAHLRLAWIYLTRYSPEYACETVALQILEYVKVFGAEDKFNHTLTLTSMKIVGRFIHESSAADFKDFINEFPHLKSDFRGLIAKHYSFDVFNSAEARRTYIAPDLLPFD